MLHKPRGVNIIKKVMFSRLVLLLVRMEAESVTRQKRFSHYVSQLQGAPHNFSKHAKCFPVNFQPKTFCFYVSAFARVGGDNMK